MITKLLPVKIYHLWYNLVKQAKLVKRGNCKMKKTLKGFVLGVIVQHY